MSATLTADVTASRLASQIMVLAWFDSSAESALSVVALKGTEAIAPAEAYRRLFSDGDFGAMQCLPWLLERDAPRGALCAYGAIVGAPFAGQVGPGVEAARIYSGAAFHPTAQDRIRLKREFHAFLRNELRSPLPAAELFTSCDEGMRGVEICVLSGEVRTGDVPSAISDGEFGVLVRLALSPGPVSGRNLAEMIWPDRDSDAASKLLKVYLHRIRTRLGSHEVIRSTDRGYETGPGVVVDLPRLEQRVRSYAGKVRCPEPDAAEFRRSCAAIAKRGYRRLSEFDFFPALESRIEVLGTDLATVLARSAPAFEDERSLEVADDLLRTAPACEAAVELAMRAYLAAGDHDGARSRYRAYCELLERDLDALPSPRLRALAAKLSLAPGP
jgi:DNA-binding SARP family transcriptional activator